MRKITLAFVSFLLSATGTLFAQHAKKYADLTLDEYNSEYAEMKRVMTFLLMRVETSQSSRRPCQTYAL